MRSPKTLIIPIALILLLTACRGSDAGASEPASQPPSAPPESAAPASLVPASSTPTPASSAPAAPSEPVASDGLEAFTCDLPVDGERTAPIANIIDVRVGTHAGYDRVVFEFEQGTPEFRLDRAEPPFTQDGSGFPVEVDGTSFLSLVMPGGSRQTDEGTSSYDGPSEFSPAFPVVEHVIEGGDFERQSTWYVGLASESCVRVLLLDGPPRLVIDIEH